MVQSQKPIPTIPFTAEAYEKLKQEKAKLTATRVEVMARLKEAREQGDLKENGAYQYAKFELGNIGRQLRDLNHQLHNGYIATPSKTATLTAQFGTLVTIENIADHKKLSFTLVSEYESNPSEHKLSVHSPIGAAVSGKKLNDTFTVTTPGGEKKYVVVSLG